MISKPENTKCRRRHDFSARKHRVNIARMICKQENKIIANWNLNQEIITIAAGRNPNHGLIKDIFCMNFMLELINEMLPLLDFTASLKGRKTWW